MSFSEKHRLQFHFSPEKGWMNDPNGMVYFDGEYHLFYQYYPDDIIWGPMHWGHAISKDLIHWKQMPIALYPDSLGWIFSGCAVVDYQNTSKLGSHDNIPIVVIFTHHNDQIEKTGSNKYQYQSIAYSVDKGRTWTKYKNNPILENPGLRDFRDPKVFWHFESNKWIMTVSTRNYVKFYGSINLLDWHHLSDFGEGIGCQDGVWECPDLFPLETNSGKKYWILIQNMNPGNPRGGSGTQYFIGQFDGKQFSLDANFKKLLTVLPKRQSEGEIFLECENQFFNWHIYNNAFGFAYTHFGSNLIHSSQNNPESSEAVELVSKEFIIHHDFINLHLQASYVCGKVLIMLEVKNTKIREIEVYHQAKGEWIGWDVKAYQGEKCRIRIIDFHKLGHIDIPVKKIHFSNLKATINLTNAVWLDAGRDNYAGVTWSNAPDPITERTFIGWMNNWNYAQKTPTEKWRGAMTLAWSLTVHDVNGIPRLKGYPKMAHKLSKGNKIKIEGLDKMLPPSRLAYIHLNCFNSEYDHCSVKLSNKLNEYVILTFDSQSNTLLFDRSKSGCINFHHDFASPIHTLRVSDDEDIEIEMFLDHSSIEIFVDGGFNIITERFYPNEPFDIITCTNLYGYFQEIKKS